jgi:hypothetical protein
MSGTGGRWRQGVDAYWGGQSTQMMTMAIVGDDNGCGTVESGTWVTTSVLSFVLLLSIPPLCSPQTAQKSERPLSDCDKHEGQVIKAKVG